MTNWLQYDVLIPLIPIPLVLFGAWLMKIKKCYVEVIKDGQLCFFSTSLLATLFRDINTTKGAYPPPSWVYGVIIILIMISMFVYAVSVVNTSLVDEYRSGITSSLITIAVIFFVASVRATINI